LEGRSIPPGVPSPNEARQTLRTTAHAINLFPRASVVF
jgi:hypothetical protein